MGVYKGLKSFYRASATKHLVKSRFFRLGLTFFLKAKNNLGVLKGLLKECAFTTFTIYRNDYDLLR